MIRGAQILSQSEHETVTRKVSEGMLMGTARGILRHSGRVLDSCDVSKADILCWKQVRDGVAEIVVNEVKRHS